MTSADAIKPKPILAKSANAPSVEVKAYATDEKKAEWLWKLSGQLSDFNAF